MNLEEANYGILIKKIDEFTRKFYLNKILRGCIYFASTLFVGYLAITLAEYYGNFEPIIRTILVFLFLILTSYIFLKWIFLPLTKYYKLGNTISHEQAAEIIGKHFSPIKDKLLNTLQLKKLAENNPHQQSLILAGINQKISELKSIPFTAAVQLNENKKYIKYALVPFVILVLIAFTAPSIFSESTIRLINYNKQYIPKAPFDFNILNKSLTTMQGNDFELRVKITGNEIPQDIYLEDGVNSFKLEKENITTFHYIFKNIQEDKVIRLSAGNFSSNNYKIAVKAKPVLLSFDVSLQYPPYLNKSSETITNSGDLTVPAGTQIKWMIRTAATPQMLFTMGKQAVKINPIQGNNFTINRTAKESSLYSISPLNNEFKSSANATYTLTVIADLPPLIEVSEKIDSVNKKINYFIGKLSDDHGFTKLNFVYRISGSDHKSKTIVQKVNADLSATQASFFYVWDTKNSTAKPGEQIEYYFEIYDNDGFNGPKVTRSAVKLLTIPTEHEAEKILDAGTQNVKEKMADAIKMASQVEHESKKMNQDLLNKKSLSFDEKKQIEQLLQKQKDLQQLVKDIQDENRQNLLDKNENRKQQEEILEKQKQIENLFNNVLDEKTREILKNIEKLLEQNNKNLTQDELSKMQTDSKTLQKELDRILELYKQLEFDQKLAKNIDKLNELAKKQDELSNKTSQKNADINDLKKEQQDLNNAFKNIRQDLKDLQKKNEQLQSKNNFDNPEKEQQQIEDQQQQSSTNLNKRNNKQASQNQKAAADNMEQLSQKLSDMQQEESENENEVNSKDLRQILDNLIATSFDQEKVMQILKITAYNDPNYVTQTQKQREVKDNMMMIQDSLYSLSKRVPQIESTVNKEIMAVNSNINGALGFLADRKTPEAARSQQYAMTSINNLALMLSEVLDQLKKAQKNAKSGKGKSKKSLSQLSKMQEQLNKNMEKARQQMQQNGNQPNGQQSGKGEMSEQLAKMAREQQIIRQGLQEINLESNKNGTRKLGNLDKVMKDMEQTETDLVNKRIQQETIKRQQEILTKLLDSEKADREREEDKKRESKTALDRAPNYNLMLQEYHKIKQQETELLRTISPSLNSFYKIRVGDYLKLLNSGTKNDE